jgi:hypothetical protein
LIHRAVDGALTQEEEADLHTCLNRSPEAKRLFDDLKLISSSLKSHDDVEPPMDLRSNILRSVDFSLYGRRSPSNPWYPLRSVLELFTFPRFVAPFAAGVVVAALLLFFVFDLRVSDNSEPTGLTGTIISDEAIKGFDRGDSFRFQLENLLANLETKTSKNLVVAELEIHSKQQVEVIFTVDGVDMCFSAFRQEEGGSGQLIVNENISRLTTVGDQRYLLFFTGKKGAITPFNVKFVQNGSTLYEKTVTPRLKGE